MRQGDGDFEKIERRGWRRKEGKEEKQKEGKGKVSIRLRG